MTRRTKGEKKAYLDGFEMCAECIESYMTSAGRKQLERLLVVVKNALEVEDIEPLESERRISEEDWIPVSKRLPEDRREVLVTAYWHETYQVMMASYYGDGLWWCVPFNNCGEHMQRLNPKAWMPLPEPYKSESEEI